MRYRWWYCEDSVGFRRADGMGVEDRNAVAHHFKTTLRPLFLRLKSGSRILPATKPGKAWVVLNQDGKFWTLTEEKP